MPIRTDATDVGALLGLTLTAGTLDPFIADAALWVDNYLSGQTCVDSDKLASIEKYLAAHFYTIAQQGGSGPVIEARRADIAEKYAAPPATSQDETTYLRTAIAFDSCGIIAERFLNRHRPKWRVGTGYQSTTGAP